MIKTHFTQSDYKEAVKNIDKNNEALVNAVVREKALKDIGYENALKMNENKLSKQISKWKKNNKSIINDIRENISNSIPLLKQSEIKNIINMASETQVLYGKSGSAKAKPKYDSIDFEKSYSKKIATDFFEYLNQITRTGTVKKQTGSSLINNTRKLDREMLYQYTGKNSKINPAELKNQFSKIKKDGKFMAFDIETLGGKNKFGQQVLDFITEFSFGEVDYLTGKLNSNKMFGSIIGIQPGSETHKEVLKVLDEINKHGYITDRHKVIADRLMKAGHEKSSAVPIKGKPGLFKYESFAGDIDISGYDYKTALKGVESLVDIGEKQSKSKVKFAGKEIFAWEKELINGIESMSGKDGLTGVTYNGANFDIPNIQSFLNSDLVSPNAKSLIRSQKVGNNMNHFDFLASMRLSNKSDEVKGMFDAGELKASNSTSFKLETIVRKIIPGFYDNKVAHVAATDIEALGKLISHDVKKDGDSFADLIMSGLDDYMQPIALRGGGQQLFYAKNSIGIDSISKFGMMSFVDDPFTEEIRTATGLAIKDGKTVKESFGQWPIQRGVSYTIDNIREHSMSERWNKEISKLHPEINMSKLVTVRLSPVTNGENLKSNASVVLVGTQEQIMETMQKNMLLTADKMGTDSYKPLEGKAGEIVEDLMSSTTFENGKIVGKKFHTIERQLEESSRMIKTEAAARARREFSVSKESKLLNIIEDIKAEAVNRGVKYDAKFRKQMMQEMMYKSGNVSKGIASNINITSAANSVIKSFHDYNNKKAYRETIDQAVGSIEYSASLETIMKPLVDMAKTKGNGNKEAENYLLKEYFESFVSEASSYGIGKESAINNELLSVKNISMNKYEIDISDLARDDADKILSINLDGGNYDLADKVRAVRNNKPFNTKQERVKELKLFGKTIGVNNIDLNNDTEEVAINKILTPLRENRKRDVLSGRITETRRMNVEKASPLSRLTQNQIDEITANVFKKVNAPAEINSGTAKDIADMLFSNVSSDDLSKYGYNEKQVKTMLHFRELRKKDTVNLLEDMLKGIDKSGASLLIDNDNASLSVIYNGKIKPIEIAKDVFEDGRFYTQVGRSKIETPIGFFANKKGNIELMSSIGRAHENGYGYMEKVLPRGVEQGDFLHTFERYMKNVNKSIRENSSVYSGDLQDTKSVFHFNIEDAIAKLYDYNKQGIFDDVEFSQDSEMRKLLNKELNIERINFKDRKLLYDNTVSLLEKIAIHENMSYEAVEYARAFGYGNKNTDGFTGTIDRVSGIANAYSPDKRGIDNQNSRAVMFDEAEVSKAISENKELSGIKTGKSLYMNTEAAHYRKRLHGTSSVYNSHITANSLTISNKDLRNIINEMADSELANGNTVKDLLTGAHLNEGSALGNPMILDKVFKAKNSIQKINIQKMVDIGHEQISELEKITNAAPKITFNPDGTIGFEYNSGQFVKRQDEILKIKGLEGGTPDTEFAKYDGTMRFGAFTKTQARLASEKDVAKILNANAEAINKSASPIATAYKVLQDTFDLEMYINPLDVNVHRKAMISSLEKNTVSYLALGVGDSGNPLITETLKALGLEKSLGTVVGGDYIRSLENDDLSKSLFSSWIKGVSGKSLSHSEIENIIADNAGVSPKDFSKLLFEERYSVWNKLEEELGKKGISSKNGIHYISDNRESFEKHKDVSKYLEDISTRLQNIHSPEDSYRIMSGAIPGLKMTEDGKFIIPENTRINSDKLKEIAEDNNLRMDSDNFEIAPVSVSHVSSHYDAGPSSYSADGRHRLSKPMRITDRHFNMMEMDIYDEDTINRISSSLDEDLFNRSFGHMLDGDKLSSEYKNKAVNESVVSQIKSERMVRHGVGPDDGLIVRNGKIVKSGPMKRRITELSANGIDLENPLNLLTNKGYKNISLSAVEDLYSASRMEAAKEWNNGSIGSIDSMKKLGFQNTDLDNLDLSKKLNSGYDQSGFEKNLLIDLHDDRLGNRQIYSGENDRYLAIPFEPQKYYSDEEDMSELHSKVTRLQSLRNEAVAGDITDAERAELQSKMISVKSDINQTISKNITGKKKKIAELSTVNLTNSARFTASGHQLFGNETSKYYKNLEFDGINLVDAAKNNVEYDYAFAGREYFNKTYLNKKYLKDVGISYEDMVELLKTKGSMELLIREPADYKRTLGMANVYLNDSIKGDTIKVGAAGVLSKGGDFDGDQFGLANFRADASIMQEDGTWKTAKINNITYDLLIQRGANLKLDNENVFKDAKAAMHMYSIENKAYSSLQKEVQENFDSIDDFVVDRYAMAGELWPNSTQGMSPSQVKKAINQYDEINNALMDKHGLTKNKLIVSENYKDMALEYIDDMSSSGAINKEDAIKAMAVGSHMQAEMLERGIKASKLAAGESNFFLYNMKRTMNIMRKSGIDISKQESDVVQQISLAIQENFLAPKNVSEIDENMLEDLKLGISSMFGTNGQDRDPSVMKNFLMNSNIMERKELKIARELTGLSIDEQIDMFSNIGSKAEFSPSLNRYLRQGIIDNGLSAGDNLITTGKGVEMIDDSIQMVRDILSNEGIEHRIEQSQLLKSRERLSNVYNTEWQAPTSNNYKRAIRDRMDDLSHHISKSKLTGRNLAFGALGLAGAAMIAGFVGGNPSRPATEEAQAQSNQDAYVVPSMIDQEIANMPSANHGYIININASTRKGRKQAIEAIQQAAASNQNSSVNVSMNITDSYGNVSDENVRKSIERAFS